MAKKSRKSNSTSLTPTAAGCVLDKNLARRDAKHLGLNKGDLPNSIKEVISTLAQAGFEAYIVGGGVRDSLLGLKPKDFDAVTNATPNEIKDVFGKRCRIIGRRFQLCHVYSGRDMIEVATFRAPPKDTAHLTEDGMIMRDNVWGDIYQDVVRRDFSINALYYQPHDGIVYDFCGGLDDINRRTIRLLGDTQKRIEEDPVRLLRALRFKAKLNFNFDQALNQQFNAQSWSLLSQVSPHRLYDETQKMFTGGYLIPLLPLLFDYGALSQLFFYPPTVITPLVEQVTINTDKRIGEGKSINPAFFYAALLWENYLYLLDKFKKNTPFSDAQIQAANKVMDKQRPHTAMPKFAEQFIKDIWLMQPRLANPRKKNLLKLFENPRFRAGFDFLMLREQVEAKNTSLAKTHGEAVTLDDESTNGMGHWWAWFQTLNAKQQQSAIDEFDIDNVKIRFANILNSPSESSLTVTQPKNRRERHQAAFEVTQATKKQHDDWAQDANSDEGFLHSDAYERSNQDQLEKDQLRQLSLANQQTATQPAKSLWQTANLVDAPALLDSHHREIDKALIKPSRKTRRRRDSEMRFGQNKVLLSQQSTSKSTSSQTTNAVPARRRRRVPSSNLSIVERHQIEQTIADKQNDVGQINDTSVIDSQHHAALVKAEIRIASAKTAKPIPKKRIRKSKSISTAPTVSIEQTEAITGNIEEKNSVTKKTEMKKASESNAEKPKRAPRPRKALTNQQDTTLLDSSQPTDQTVKKIPAKRTRKPIVTADNTGNVE